MDRPAREEVVDINTQIVCSPPNYDSAKANQYLLQLRVDLPLPRSSKYEHLHLTSLSKMRVDLVRGSGMMICNLHFQY
jgi:hypothetical protein